MNINSKQNIMTKMTKFKTIVTERLKEIINWSIHPYPNGLTTKFSRTQRGTVKQLRDEAKKKEFEWGNSIINQKDNGNWSTTLGQNLVRDVLKLLGKNPRKPEKKDGYIPDWECDDAIYEVKTRNWTTGGSAGEKVLGVMYKYSDIPVLYGKPLYIVLVAYQEYEYTLGNTKIFGENISERKKTLLDTAAGMDIKYLKFSDLVLPLIEVQT
tara:strand:+ start:5779 stop:6411 length:633 start_codon:yes stop_codon:yes gene_type:complete